MRITPHGYTLHCKAFALWGGYRHGYTLRHMVGTLWGGIYM